MIPFYRLSGAGNDFLALPEPARPPTADQVRAWCRRGTSLGADGVFVLRRLAGGGVAMDYANADGSAAGLCLNGTRCAARLAFELGWAAAGEPLVVVTGAGPLACRRLDDDRIAVEVPAPRKPPERLRLDAGGGVEVEGWRMVVGVPHLVLEWDGDLAAAPIAELGPPLRRHPALGAAGANVDLVRFPAPGRLEIRTWERGVEAETLACGTGVLAATAVGLAVGRAALPLTAATRGGFDLGVAGETRAEADGAVAVVRWQLAGDARLLARGEILPAAAETPPAVRWG